jgi:hypothetical protein
MMKGSGSIQEKTDPDPAGPKLITGYKENPDFSIIK